MTEPGAIEPSALAPSTVAPSATAPTRDATLVEALAVRLARPVPVAARQRAALHLLDWIGCALAGAADPTGIVFARDAAGRARGASLAIGVGRLEAETAAFVNGAYGNVLEMDDVHRTAILHPGPITIPAALALAEALDAPASALLDAIVRGYEAVIRVGRSLGPGHYHHWHKTSTAGPFGAAAAAASLLGLEPDRTAAALALAGTQSSGPWQCRLEGGQAKQLHTAAAARAGLGAARLAAAGLDGPRAILEGPLGLYAATCPDPDPQAVLRDDGPAWLIDETSFKPWPACRHAHPAIDAALALRDTLGDAPVESVTVESYADALAYCDGPSPSDALGAKFSLQHAVAIALLDGPPRLAAFAESALVRADVAALRERVRVAVAEDLERAYPAHWGARVRVVTASGRSLERTVHDALGDPDNPVSPAEIADKAHMLMAATGIDDALAQALIERTGALTAGGTVAALTALLPAAPGAGHTAPHDH